MLSKSDKDKYYMSSIVCVNLKNKTKLKLINTDKRLVVSRSMGWGMGVIDKRGPRVKRKYIR